MNWQPIETAPWMTPIWVRNDQMSEPAKATRGYATEIGVHPDTTFCTSLFTEFPDGGVMRAGHLICPTEWAPIKD